MTSLLDLVLRLLGGDEELTKAYHQDPAGFADKHFGDLASEDWKDLHLVLDQSGMVERHAAPAEHESTSNHTHNAGDHAVAQLHNIVNNYTQIDDRHTITNQSNTQMIDTGGGDFWQRIDNSATTASGDGAVAAGHDINAPVNTGAIDNSDKSTDTTDTHASYVQGDGNVVGDGDTGNAVGDHDKVDDSTHADDHSQQDNGHSEHDGDHEKHEDGDHSKDEDGQHEKHEDGQHHSDAGDSYAPNVDDSFNHNDDSFNDAHDSFNHSDDTFNHSNVVDDDSSNTQSGLINVNDVLSHNNVPIDVDVPIHIL